MKAALKAPRVRAICLLLRNGRPVVEDEWVRSLLPHEREIVERSLAARGFRFNGNSVEEIDNGNSGNERP
jgi:hypothetical protein